MYAIEFLTKIDNDIIRIPKDYWEQLRVKVGDKNVRVIVLTNENAVVEEENFIDRLLNAPLQAANFSPLTRDETHERA